MGDIIIKKLSPAPVYTYHVRNLNDVNVELEVPALIYQIPESTDDEAIGIKVEGNKSIVNLSWTLVDDEVSVVDGMTLNTGGIKTADEQMAFLLTGDIKTDAGAEYHATNNPLTAEGMQPTGTQFAYEIKLMPNTGNTPFFEKSGILTRISVSKSGQTPVTYNASIQFSTGSMTAKNDVIEAGT